MGRGKPKFDMKLVGLVKKYMGGIHKTFSPTDIMNDIVTLDEYSSASRPRLLKQITMAYNFHLKKQNGSLEKDKGNIQEVSSDEEDAEVMGADPDINVQKLMKYAVQKKEKVGRKRKELEDDEDDEDETLAPKRRNISEDSLLDDKDQRLKALKKKFQLIEPHTDVPVVLFEKARKNLNPVKKCLMGQGPESVRAKAWMIVGPSGCGKTSLIHIVGTYTAAQMLSISYMDILSLNVGSEKKYVEEAFELAKLSPPCILHLDKLDQICSSSSSGSMSEQEKKLTETIVDEIEKLRTGDHRVLVIAETSSPEKLDENLRYAFNHVTHIPPLTSERQKDVLKFLCADEYHQFDVDFDVIVAKTPGFVGGDLKRVVKNSIKLAKRELWRNHCSYEKRREEFFELAREVMTSLHSDPSTSYPTVTTKHMLEAVKGVTPELKQGFPEIARVSMDDIGSLDAVKEKIQNLFTNPLKFPHLYKNCRRPHHILFWGPPGCGKTLMAQALANQAGLNFLSVKCSDILSKYQGESERMIREIFDRASKVPPCLIFLDELDAICGRRSKSTDSGSRSSIVTSILVNMDGFEKKDNVFLLGATNQPHALDPSALRPGRFQTLIYLGLPDEEARKSILKVCLKPIQDMLLDDIDVEAIAADTEGFSGADLAGLVGNALKNACARTAEKFSSSPDVAKHLKNDTKISNQDFIEVRKTMSPSVSKEEQARFAKFEKKFGSINISVPKTSIDENLFEEDETEQQEEKASSNTASQMNMSIM